ncbi:hypothetical protein [Synergistes jonesii]|uniref:hypothetical protein n=1 Tax=Synergistes jonesii TaxID=2754 RepID=UPI00242DF83D|nr:hypothetical protein [Synergistes jonesii]
MPRKDELAAAKKRFAAAMDDMALDRVIRRAPLQSVAFAAFAGALVAVAAGSLRAVPIPIREIYSVYNRLARLKK